ncbi:MAG: IS30 family transposase, partial [Arthrobacter sp.]|nr:IS30 family transposase [Arthrobacter sp.]
RVIGGQRAAIPSKPSKRQGDLGHTRRPRVIETLRQPRNHPQQNRKEGDLIIGKGNKSAIGTLVERTTNYTMLVHLPDGYRAEQMRDALTAKIKTLPEALRHSLTWDQGIEMQDWKTVKMDAGIDIYFCDPHSPWQRGINENTNGLLRQYFPKGTDLSIHSATDLDWVAQELNDRPRKRLEFRKPIELIERLLLQ